ncbi:MAG: hypothetical protein ACK5LC_16625 [Coprobacillaceae bacterium]
MKKIIITLCILFSLVGLTGCSSKEAVVQEAYQDEQGYTIHRRGETVQLGDFEVTYKSSGASDKTKEPSVNISLKIKNNGPETKTFTEYNDVDGTSVGAYVVDKNYMDVEGYQRAKILASDSDITDKDIESGKEIDGSLYFSSPEVTSKEFNEAGYYLLLIYGEEYVVFLIEEAKYE